MQAAGAALLTGAGAATSEQKPDAPPSVGSDVEL